MNELGKNALLKMAGKKLGLNPNQLKSDLEKGDLTAVTKGMSKEESDKLKKVLSDPTMTKKIFESKEAQELMKKLSGKG